MVYATPLINLSNSHFLHAFGENLLGKTIIEPGTAVFEAQLLPQSYTAFAPPIGPHFIKVGTTLLTLHFVDSMNEP